MTKPTRIPAERIFEKEEQLETRQYWPIFQHNITAAGTDVLWNNYGYGQ